jgi:hypothetical protein
MPSTPALTSRRAPTRLCLQTLPRRPQARRTLHPEISGGISLVPLWALSAVIAIAVAAYAAPIAVASVPASSATNASSTSSRAFASPNVFAPRIGTDALTFDDVPIGTTITTHYVSNGVNFVSAVFTTTDRTNPTSPVLSGTPTFQGDISAEFVAPGTTNPTTVNGFSLDVGYIDSRSSVVVDYLDSRGFVVGSQYAQSLGINHLTVTYRGIASFTVHTVSTEPAGFAIDNLTIDPTVSTAVSSIASMGDSYSSGEGRTDHNYDCGTNLETATYYQDTTVPVGDPLGWLDGFDCDTRTLSHQRPGDLLSRPWTVYDNLCHRHGQAYPNLIAQALHAQQAIFVACSGARTFNVGATQGGNPPQKQHPMSPVNVAGGETQLTNVTDFRKQRLGDHDPDVITIGIGGNDAKFVELASHCVSPRTDDCTDGTNWANEVLSTINGDVFDRLVDTFTTLRTNFQNSTLLVFGYPTVVDPGATCGARLGFMDSNETRFLGGTVLDALNSAVSDAAAQAGAFYVDISRVTVGHGVCSDDPWINPIIIEGFGVASESLHPNVTAHQQTGKFFADHYTDGQGNLLVANPPPSGTIRPAVGQSMHLATLHGQVEESCGAGCLQPTVCVQTCQIHLQGEGYSPAAQLHLVLNSTPVSLGDATADQDGKIDTKVTIPAGTELGLHWLTVDGTATDGTAQYGTLAINVYATKPPPTRIHPPTTPASDNGTTPTATNPGHVVINRKPVAVNVRMSRRGANLTVRLTCPRTASSSCKVSAVLRRTVRAKRHGAKRRTRTITLLKRNPNVGVGRTAKLVLKRPEIKRTRKSLRLYVETTTSAGTRTANFSIPR